MTGLLIALVWIGAAIVAVAALRRGQSGPMRLAGLLVAAALVLFGLRLPQSAVLALTAGAVLFAVAARQPQRRWARRRSPWRRPAARDGVSTVRTARIEVTLDHATGRMQGRVLDGPHAGARLEALCRDEVLEIAAAVPEDDARTLTLLTTYLDRMHPGWSEAGGAAPDAADATAMTLDQALNVLGLDRGATRAEVIAAHRRLIKRVHPDVGGSSVLTTQINAAKTRLLEAGGLP